MRFVNSFVLSLVVASASLAVAAEPVAKKEGDPAPAGDRLTQIENALAEIVDADQDGAISDLEAQKAVGQAKAEANAKKKGERGQAILDALDANKNGKVEDQEAAEAIAQARRERDEIGQRVGEVFDKLDLDGSKAIDNQEFLALIQQLGPLGELIRPKLGQFFDRMDIDRNRQISVVESQFAADFFAQQLNWQRQKEKQAKNEQIVRQVQETMTLLDGNKNGEISIREASKRKDLASLVTSADLNSDRKVDAEELYKFYSKSQTAN